MKQSAIAFAAILCAAAPALFSYGYFIMKPRAAAQTTVVQVDLTKAQIQDQAQGIANNLDAAVTKTMSKLSDTMGTPSSEMQQGALAADALARASSFKVMIAEYYLSHNQWPKYHADLGMAKPESYAGGAVDSISVEEKGIVVILLNDKIQSGAKIKLIPELNEQSFVFNWYCTTEGSDTLKRHLTMCTK
jgi:hypothetical protein